MIYHTHDKIIAKGTVLRNRLDDLERTVRESAQDLREHLDEFDSIVVTGMSGVLVGSPLALRLKKPLVVLRKNAERTASHSSAKWINDANLGARALWLDDFTSTGATQQRVREAVAVAGSQVVKQYMYHDRKLQDVEPFTFDVPEFSGRRAWIQPPAIPSFRIEYPPNTDEIPF